MSDIKKSIIESLDGQDEKLLPRVPYLLQDLWEIGASPPHLVEMIRRNRLSSTINRALDLGCGKGAVSIRLAQAFGWQVHGIDAMPDFIERARLSSRQHGTAHLCSFAVRDIRTAIKTLRGFDLVILGSIGPVLGSIQETLLSVSACLNRPGYVLLDDGYSKGDDSNSADRSPNRSEALRQIDAAGCTIVDELIYSTDFIRESNRAIYSAIARRADELTKKYPEDEQLLQDYLAAQGRENEALEKEMSCVTWLLAVSSSGVKS